MNETCPYCGGERIRYLGSNERIVVNEAGDPRLDLVVALNCEDCRRDFDGEVIDTIWSDQNDTD